MYSKDTTWLFGYKWLWSATDLFVTAGLSLGVLAWRNNNSDGNPLIVDLDDRCKDPFKSSSYTEGTKR